MTDVHLRDLRYFVAVAEELSFTRAAERLFVSQPALSKQVRMLERQLGTPLFERTARGVSLTPAGAALLPEASATLERWRAGESAVRRASSASLVFGLQTAVGRDLLREALADVRRRGIRVSLRLVPWNDPSAGLADQTSDVAALWLPTAVDGVTTRTLVTEERWVALPSSHPLAGSERIPFPALASEPFIALPKAAGPLRDFWLAVDQRSTPAEVALESGSADETLEAVASGLGVALLARGNADLYARPDVVCRPVDGIPPARLALAWRTGDQRPEVACLVRACLAHLRRDQSR